MQLVDRLEAGVNWLTDRDWVWWPVARFRPKSTERFSRCLVVGLSLPVAFAVTIVCVGLTIREVGWSGPNPDYPQTPAMWAAVAFLFALIVFVTWGSVVMLMAYCWNRRAARLTGVPVESERALNARARQLQPVAPPSRDLTYLVVISLIAYSMVAFREAGGSPDAGQGIGLFLLFPAAASLGLMWVWRLVVWRVTRLRLTGSTAYKAVFSGTMISFDAFLLMVPESGNWPTMGGLTIVSLLAIVVPVHAGIAAIIKHPETGPMGIRKGAMVSAAYCGAIAVVAATGWALSGPR